MAEQVLDAVVRDLARVVQVEGVAVGRLRHGVDVETVSGRTAGAAATSALLGRAGDAAGRHGRRVQVERLPVCLLYTSRCV